MYTGILHTHTLAVVLFLLLYLVKTFLLVTGKENALENITRITKWPERIISVLFLATGIYLYANSGNITWMVNLKILLVLASIPLAIIGFKKKKSPLAIASVFLLFVAYGLAEMNKKSIVRIPSPVPSAETATLETGKILYTTYCAPCHGANGDAGLSGAKNLRISALTDQEKEAIIQNGKGNMPGFPQLSSTEAKAILLHTATLAEK